MRRSTDSITSESIKKELLKPREATKILEHLDLIRRKNERAKLYNRIDERLERLLINPLTASQHWNK